MARLRAADPSAFDLVSTGRMKPPSLSGGDGFSIERDAVPCAVALGAGRVGRGWGTVSVVSDGAIGGEVCRGTVAVIDGGGGR
jgi:hypothetical protein